MNEGNSLPSDRSDARAYDYESPTVLDLGKVFDVTSGENLGTGDESGQRAC
ncbi:hypothetical protein EV192_104374 [Actinocrispum wychmicini]|uniref:Uncharacterized protein n=1 Tax=Actinocrispum wychmicini TaxID=1213861 RepID=A0A4R2JLQ7_9PSEU|nr:hypothetical protein EV192_104374 [Actinocrispum wychmicini]